MTRWRDGIPSPLPRPTPAQLREAFLWSEHRTVSKTATVSLHGNTYQVDELLVGRKVELVFDPFDLTELAVRYSGREFGPAVVHHIGRHTHPKARPEQPGTPPQRSGIDYLRLIDASHTERLEARINYAALAGSNLDPADDPADDPAEGTVVDLDAPPAGRDDLKESTP